MLMSTQIACLQIGVDGLFKWRYTKVKSGEKCPDGGPDVWTYYMRILSNASPSKFVCNRFVVHDAFEAPADQDHGGSAEAFDCR